MNDTCDHCGKQFNDLNPMQHLPGLNIGKFFRPQLWCNDCAGVQPGQTPVCPPTLLRADGTCTMCQP